MNYQAAVDSLRESAIGELIAAVSSLQDAGKSPTASEVRLRLRDSTSGGFDPKRLDFRRFRDFLDYAASRGAIKIDSNREGDIGVSIPTDLSMSDEDTTNQKIIREDLWSAFTNWDGTRQRYYDRSTQTVVYVPTGESPLEPDVLTSVRSRLKNSDPNLIEIVPVSRNKQVSWMENYAQNTADRQIRDILLAALDSKLPAKQFIAELKERPSSLDEWYDVLSQNVANLIEKWAEAHHLDIDVWVTGSKNKPTATKLKSRTGVVAAKQSRKELTHNGGDDVPRLRAILHSAIDRMSIHELRQLPVPIGYVVK